jgi:hypothetical protein
MPIKQRVAKRYRRQFSPETLALFSHLEQQRRPNREAERQLMRDLGLTSEWWTGNSVSDRSAGPCHPEGYVSRDDWYRVREVRNALLTAVHDATPPRPVSDSPTSQSRSS